MGRPTYMYQVPYSLYRDNIKSNEVYIVSAQSIDEAIAKTTEIILKRLKVVSHEDKESAHVVHRDKIQQLTVL